jgi:Regulator of chromosome condensation (RCC1) repeat
MALTEENELYTWGFNEEGQTGHTNSTDHLPTDIYRPTLLNLDVTSEAHRTTYHCHPIQMSGGGQHSIVLVRPKLK